MIGAVAPIPDVPDRSRWLLDKPAHLCEYLLFAWLVLQVVRTPGRGPAKQAALAFAIPVAFGGLMEIVQYFLPYRSSEWMDVAANAVGATIGLILGFGTAGLMSRFETSATHR